MSKPVQTASYISKRYGTRRPSPIRKLVQEGLATPGVISLAGGLPNPQCFPFVGLEAKLRSGDSLQLSPTLVSQALQYSASYGLPPLLKQLEALQQRYHAPQREVRICVETGSQSLLARAFDMFLNPGDWLLCESPTYAGTLAALQPIQPRFAPLDLDRDGLVPSSLRATLEGWDSAKGAKPKVLYTIPVGQNPSGATMSADRRVEVYSICREHDVMIIEDDPYYFLYLGPPGTDARTSKPPPSLLSMDTDGRVLRFDSLSKALSSGFRLGFVTGHPDFVERIQVDIQSTSLHASGVSQALCAALMEKMGLDGWEEHVAGVRAFYAQRRDTFLGYADKHLTGLAEWDPPAAGMFAWLKLLGCSDTLDLIERRAKEEKVLLVPGEVFYPLGGPSDRARASYSTATDDQMDQALQRLGKICRSA
eukprot:TRINITY_DN26803_c0_g1_i1.p1 TRINITY_DN26803_c0_g1~~TRINITY_DN26803_c0_g1_i1.p1  ORF type:complete len:422 (+),score=115.23 TRINITY_DN26803_c0_g1_i1:89-1354(+)